MIVDVNADVGEGGDDHRLFPHLTSVSIACGGHAGDESTMRRTLAAAAEHGLRLGAHPGYPDRGGFGRADIDISPQTLRLAIFEQLATIARVAGEMGLRLSHVKAHGALYNRAWRDPGTAAVIARATAEVLPTARLMCPAFSAQYDAAVASGLKPLREVFADRAYGGDGHGLLPREQPGAVIQSPGELARHLRALPPGDFDTVCVHGDNPAAEHILAALPGALSELGFRPGAYG